MRDRGPRTPAQRNKGARGPFTILQFDFFALQLLENETLTQINTI